MVTDRATEHRPWTDPEPRLAAVVTARAVDIRRREIPSDNNKLDDKLHPVLQRIFACRGVTTMDQLDYRLSRLHPPTGLGQLTEAASLLADAVVDGRRTLVVGDFDADGATGTALTVLALRAMGHQNIGYVVPNRFDFGYGLSAALVDHVRPEQPALLVTVDNGISSVAGVAAARSCGMAVIITDHHLPGPALPQADAIVNPNLPHAQFPSKHLAGVGVAFYTAAAVRAELARRGWFRQREEPRLGNLIDLVALGTVADLVPLDANNRVLVCQGLRRIRSGECRPGIRALLRVAGRDIGRAGAADLAFFVAPRLNAAGRLDDMSVGIECLLADDLGQAQALAEQLDRLNSERRQLQADMQDEALDQVADSAPASRIIVAFDREWHQGIVGLVASRLKERWHRPALAFAPEAPGATLLKGSARSIPGFHVRDALARVDAHHPGLIQRFGGHAMAAGLSLDHEQLPALEQALGTDAEAHLSDDLLSEALWTDGELAPEDISVDLAQLLRDWGPWGQTFPEPLFDGSFRVMERRVIGDRHTKLRVCPGDSRQAFEALLFNRLPDSLPPSPQVRLVYQLDLNEYMGRYTPQLIVRHCVGL